MPAHSNGLHPLVTLPAGPWLAVKAIAQDHYDKRYLLAGLLCPFELYIHTVSRCEDHVRGQLVSCAARQQQVVACPLAGAVWGQICPVGDYPWGVIVEPC